MLLLGTGLAGILAFVAIAKHTFERGWPVLLLLPVGFPAIILACVSPTLMFSIWVGGGRVRHVFLNRYVLSDIPVSDFQHMRIRSSRYGGLLYRRYGFSPADTGYWPGPWGVKLYFKHDRTIRFVGVHLRILHELKLALMEASGHPMKR